MTRYSRDIPDFFETAFRRLRLRDVPASTAHTTEVAEVRAGGALIADVLRNWRLIDLVDGPPNPPGYGGAAGKALRARLDETGVEFVGGVAVAIQPPTFDNNGGIVFDALNVTLNVPYPSGVAAGQVMILHASMIDASNSNATLTTPAGWTLIDGPVRMSATYAQWAFWKRATGSESGTLTITFSTSGNILGKSAAIMSAWDGAVASGTPVEAADDDTGHATTTMTGAAIVTAGAGRTVVNLYSHSESVVTTPGTGWIDAYDVNVGAPFSQHCSLVCSTKEVADAGAVSAESRTLPGSEDWIAITFALKPA